MLSCVWLFATPWTVACQAVLSMDFSSKDTGVGSRSLLQGTFPTRGSNPFHLSPELFQPARKLSLPFSFTPHPPPGGCYQHTDGVVSVLLCRLLISGVPMTKSLVHEVCLVTSCSRHHSHSRTRALLWRGHAFASSSDSLPRWDAVAESAEICLPPDSLPKFPLSAQRLSSPTASGDPGQNRQPQLACCNI